MDAFCIYTQKFQSVMSDQLQTQIEKIRQEVSPSNINSSPSSVPITTTTYSVPLAKSDRLRLTTTFPTFRKPHDDPDPLNYLTRCEYFLALHPLSDVNLLATFRPVLYGTAHGKVGSCMYLCLPLG